MTNVLIFLLVVIILLLAMTLYWVVRKSTYLFTKEKEYLNFVIDIFSEYGDDLGIQSKDQHIKLVEELNKIRKKHLK